MPKSLSEVLKISVDVAKRIDKARDECRYKRDEEAFAKRELGDRILIAILKIFYWLIIIPIGFIYFYILRPEKRKERDNSIANEIKRKIHDYIVMTVSGSMRFREELPDYKEAFLSDNWRLNKDIWRAIVEEFALQGASKADLARIEFDIAKAITQSIKDSYEPVNIDFDFLKCDIDIRPDGEIYLINIERPFNDLSPSPIESSEIQPAE